MVSEAATDLQQARQNLTLIQYESKVDVSRNDLAVKAAKLTLREYTEGKYPDQKQEIAESVLALQTKVEQARRQLEWTRRVVKKGYVTEMKLADDALALAEEEHELKLAEHGQTIFESYTNRQQVLALEAKLHTAVQMQERSTKTLAARLASEQARVDSAVAILQIEQTELERLAGLIKHRHLAGKTAKQFGSQVR